MTPDKINELIPRVHDMFKKRGDWDEMPAVRRFYEEFHCFKTIPKTEMDSVQQRNAYLASELDHITWSICDAMRAREDEIQFQDNPRARAYAVKHSDGYDALILNTEEHHLTKSLLLTLDLMGFYGVEYDNDSAGVMDLDAQGHMSNAVRITAQERRMCAKNGAWEIKQWGMYIIDIFLRIAELDKIDLEWHVEALIKYMESEKR